MSAVDPVAEPSMEEILSSIRDAINDDAPTASSPSPLDGDPFASGSTAEAAFSAPSSGQNFDSTTYRSHDPFSELARKFNETRANVHQQMQQASTPTKPSETVPPTQPAEQAAVPVAPEASNSDQPAADQRTEFSTIVSNLARRQPVPPPASADAVHSGVAVTPAPSIPASATQSAIPPVPAPAPTKVQATAPSVSSGSAAPSDSAMLDAVLRQVVEPAVKAWLDENLSRIVTDVVREEMRRVAS